MCHENLLIYTDKFHLMCLANFLLLIFLQTDRQTIPLIETPMPESNKYIYLSEEMSMSPKTYLMSNLKKHTNKNVTFLSLCYNELANTVIQVWTDHQYFALSVGRFHKCKYAQPESRILSQQ